MLAFWLKSSWAWWRQQVTAVIISYRHEHECCLTDTQQGEGWVPRAYWGQSWGSWSWQDSWTQIPFLSLCPTRAWLMPEQLTLWDCRRALQPLGSSRLLTNAWGAGVCCLLESSKSVSHSWSPTIPGSTGSTGRQRWLYQTHTTWAFSGSWLVPDSQLLPHFLLSKQQKHASDMGGSTLLESISPAFPWEIAIIETSSLKPAVASLCSAAWHVHNLCSEDSSN